MEANIQKSQDELSAARDQVSRRAAEQFSAYQAETEQKFQKELEHIKTDLGLRSAVALERQRIALNDESARSKFMQSELNRSADPILQATTDLRHRLKNILRDNGWHWLARPERADPAFQKTATYFRSSTLYVFCRYFCYVELLNERLGYLFEARGDERQQFIDLLRKGSGILGSHDDAEPGAHVFHWQQRALGEVMTETANGGERCMRYAAFLDRLRSEGFSGHIAPLEALLDDLKKDGPTWKRMEAFMSILEQVELDCRNMLQLPPINPEKAVEPKTTVLPHRRQMPSLDYQPPSRN